MESPVSQSRQKTGHRGPTKLDRRTHTAHMVGRQAKQESCDDEHNYTLSLDHVDKEAVLELPVEPEIFSPLYQFL